jgi:hypothetical protein
MELSHEKCVSLGQQRRHSNSINEQHYQAVGSSAPSAMPDRSTTAAAIAGNPIVVLLQAARQTTIKVVVTSLS